MPSPTSKVRKGQLLTSERRGIDNVFKGSSPTSSQSDLPSPLLCCLGGHQGLKSMHPTKFLGCNPWTLPFPIPAGAQGPAGLQSARSRAGPASQDSGFCPLDFQRTLGCLGNPRRLGDFSAEGWSGKGLDPKGEAFLRPPGWGAPKMYQQTAEYVVPCSTQSQCPDPWSAQLQKALLDYVLARGMVRRYF